MSVGCSDDIKKSLFHKLTILENARDVLNKELNHFTEKATKDIEDFLNFPSTTQVQEGVNLLKNFDARCLVIRQLLAVFQDLTSVLESESLKRPLTYRSGLSPESVVQFRSQNGVFVPNVLKFGPLLQNYVLSSSVTKAVQVIRATLSLPQFTLSFEAEKEDVSGQTSPNNGTGVELFNQDKCKVDEIENKQQNTTENEVSLDTFSPKGTSPSLTRNVTTPNFGQQFRNDPEVQHQKQTSSQLMCFLQRNGKTQKMPENSSFSAVERTFVLIQQQKGITEAIRQEEITLHTTHNRKLFSEINVSGPTFKLKRCNADFVTYSCVIATRSELWDVGSISAEVHNAVQGSVCAETLAVPNCNGPKVFDLFNHTVCASSDEPVNTAQMEHHYVSEELTEGTIGDESLVRMPEFQIKKFEEMPVFATHVVSPSKFYIQQKDSNLQKLSEVMARKSCKSYAERKCIPDIGTYVMGWFPEQGLWCRAQVIKICVMNSGSSQCTSLKGVGNLEVKVRRIDYGDSACLFLSNVKELPREVAQVPVQALKVSLANVNPENGQSWSVEAVNWFKDKVNARTLHARFFPEGGRVLVELFMEKGKLGAMRRGASLSIRLAQNGFAKHNQMKNMGLKRSPAQERPRKQLMEWEKYLLLLLSK